MANPENLKPFQPGHDKPGPGRPSKMQKWREMVEADFEKWVKPFEDSLEAVQSASYQGEVKASDVPALDARVAAAEKVLDRVYGRPNQTVQHSGEISMRVSLLDALRATEEST